MTTPGPYFRAKLCALFGKSAEELGLVGRVNLIRPDHTASQGGKLVKQEAVTGGDRE